MEKGYFDLWTVQDASVLREVQDTGLYVPIIDKSEFLKEYEDGDDVLYEMGVLMRRMFNVAATGVAVANELVPSELPGVVFCFAFYDLENNKLRNVDNFTEFMMFAGWNKKILGTLWNKFLDSDNKVLLHLRVPNYTNPVAVDYNAWQLCMPPFDTESNAFRDIRKDIMTSMAKGEQQYVGVLGARDYDVMQCHLPCISKEMLVNYFPVIDIKENLGDD